jgi:hypothetical protein
MTIHILRNFYNKNNIYLMKYIKFDYRNTNYHLIQCWKSNLHNNMKIFNIDFIANKKLNYIKINNLSINNDYYHNNQDEYYDNEKQKYKIVLENNLIINKNKFYIDIELNKNKIELNRIITSDTNLKNNDYILYNYNLEKVLDDNEYKIIKKIIFSSLCTYANYEKISNITMTINNNKKRFNAELKEEGFKIDYNYQFNHNYSNDNLNIIKTI